MIPDEAVAENRERKAATRETMMQVYETVAEDEKAPHMARIMAADKWLDRTEGKPMQKTVNENTGPDGGPIVHEVVYRWDSPKPE